MKKMLSEGNQIHNFISSSGSGTVNNYGSGSDFLTSYGSGSMSQKITVPTVPVPVTQRCLERGKLLFLAPPLSLLFPPLYLLGQQKIILMIGGRRRRRRGGRCKVRVHVTSQQPIGILGKELFATYRTTITGTVVGVAIAVSIGSKDEAILRRRGSKGAAGTPGGLLRGRKIGSVGRGKVGLEGRHPGKAHGAQRAGVLAAAAAAHRLHGGRQVVQVSAVHVNFQLHSVPAGEGAERTGQLKVRGSAAPQAKLGVKFQKNFHLETR
jgi:hypothetical protein